MSLIYEIKCECGNTLSITSSSIDKDHDVWLTVEKCNDCYLEAFAEGQKDAEE